MVLENDVYGGIFCVYVFCKLDQGLGDCRRSVLLGEEDVPRPRWPLEGEEVAMFAV
jgi:hypothetical protein